MEFTPSRVNASADRRRPHGMHGSWSCALPSRDRRRSSRARQGSRSQFIGPSLPRPVLPRVLESGMPYGLRPNVGRTFDELRGGRKRLLAIVRAACRADGDGKEVGPFSLDESDGRVDCGERQPRTRLVCRCNGSAPSLTACLAMHSCGLLRPRSQLQQHRAPSFGHFDVATKARFMHCHERPWCSRACHQLALLSPSAS
jgi:hypothetical protein